MVRKVTIQQQQQQQDDEVPLPPPPPPAIHIVTWYMSNHDAITFAPLLDLLYTPSYVASLQVLEFVLPHANVSATLVQRMVDFISSHAQALRQVVLYIPQGGPALRNVSSKEAHYMRDIQQAAKKNSNIQECSMKFLDQPGGDPSTLCHSLSTTIDGRLRRHLALDGCLLLDEHGNLEKTKREQLAHDLSWDRSIAILLLKDIESIPVLATLLPKLANGPLHTLKWTYDPCNDKYNHDQQQIPPILNVEHIAALSELITSPKLKTLQRLYFGHVQWQPPVLLALSDAILQHLTITTTTLSPPPALLSPKKKKSKTPPLPTLSLQHLEFCVCEFEAGTGRELQQLVKGVRKETQKLASKPPSSATKATQDEEPLILQFTYPILLHPHKKKKK